MSGENAQQPPRADAEVSDEALHRAEQYIEEEEGHANRLVGWLGVFVTLVAVAISLFHLYTAYAIVPAQRLRPLHVAMILALCFLVFPVAKRFRHRIWRGTGWRCWSERKWNQYFLVRFHTVSTFANVVLVSIVIFMLLGYSPVLSVFWASSTS